MNPRSPWAEIARIPVWVLRAWLVVVGMIGSVALAVGMAAYWFIDFGPPVDLSITNRSSHEAAVQLDGRTAKTVAASDELRVSDDHTGPHRLTLTSDEPHAVKIVLTFDAGRWGSDVVVEIRSFDDQPLLH